MLDSGQEGLIQDPTNFSGAITLGSLFFSQALPMMIVSIKAKIFFIMFTLIYKI